jgi:hypothetical protein
MAGNPQTAGPLTEDHGDEAATWSPDIMMRYVAQAVEKLGRLASADSSAFANA